MSSNVITEIVCPECGGSLKTYWDRNNMRAFIRCSKNNISGTCYFECGLEDLEYTFLKQYYKRNGGLL